ncbi:uncharacterized protein PHACADRAFT_251207 [Phanerochaete carnosa HHB-10118-sp]|uniref:Uncharacterized protein n=1 Tax=Phanerochaete carnosa (strain HHB-10118-sp) TaxID=650164 RepID=K5V4I7_PHACS|nr:uncharacterized protein PHACADRAFT_251207 [Phanerochaete carnosa HHB-10118-sp]EKM57531.1 hypothetical protein PHACADRAFT_251207 [Phanerochaete carnosa HHB-10118-sp]
MSQQRAANTAKTEAVKIVIFDPERYPAYPGEAFNNRYVVQRKLGNGHHSDAWLVGDRAFAEAENSSSMPGCVSPH